MKNAKLEIACFDYESALIAQQGGADRVELCDSVLEGGTTPSYSTVLQARKNLQIELFVMIRPRGGDFVYSTDEFEQMKKDIKQFQIIGVDGFVFGILKDDKSIDHSQNRILVDLASPLPCTFHRAFDACNNFTQGLEDIIACGFKTILTSGQKKSALEGIDNLIELNSLAANRIVIMPGGGVRSSNLKLIKDKIKTAFYHSSAITGPENIANLNEVKQLKKCLE